MPRVFCYFLKTEFTSKRSFSTFPRSGPSFLRPFGSDNIGSDYNYIVLFSAFCKAFFLTANLLLLNEEQLGIQRDTFYT